MHVSALGDAIAKLNDEMSVELADTSVNLEAAYRLRYQVYCLERGFLVGRNGVERDEFDDHARHAVVRWRQTGEVVGTVRVVLPKIPAGGDDFPLQRVCDPTLLRGLPRATTGELSRFALAKQQTKQVRGVSVESSSLLRLALLRGALRLSAEAGHTHWVAIMRPALLRLFRASGLHFVPLGPLVEYHGLRQPAVAELVPTLARMAREQPAVWDFLTQGGTWYSAPLRKSVTEQSDVSRPWSPHVTTRFGRAEPIDTGIAKEAATSCDRADTSNRSKSGCDEIVTSRRTSQTTIASAVGARPSRALEALAA